MGERRVRLIDVARATGVSRNLLAKLYYDKAVRIELAILDKLCRYFNCSVGELFEYLPDQESPQPARRQPAIEGSA